VTNHVRIKPLLDERNHLCECVCTLSFFNLPLAVVIGWNSVFCRLFDRHNVFKKAIPVPHASRRMNHNGRNVVGTESEPSGRRNGET
jgi:hypothetical protein